MAKSEHPRASYIGGFGVGCGVPRVEVLERDNVALFQGSTKLFRCRVTSRKAYGYRYGEIMLVYGKDLFDKHWFVSGPKVVSRGKEWMEPFRAEIQAEKDAFSKELAELTNSGLRHASGFYLNEATE
jgi:hypothetical protein